MTLPFANSPNWSRAFYGASRMVLANAYKSCRESACYKIHFHSVFQSRAGLHSSTVGHRNISENVKRVAVLYQAIEPPLINGVRKPPKPGGYQDSGADIAYNLQSLPDIEVITPRESPDPANHVGWSFPDNEEGILSALKRGVTHLWANTILFASHPLQTSSAIREYQDAVRIVGQPPCMVELYDDKQYVNDMLRAKGSFTMPRAWTVTASDDLRSSLSKLNLPFPIVGKPVRGRGSHGVRVCYDLEELTSHATTLINESPVVMLEEFLAGEEATVTVMPPSKDHPDYWSLPVVTRFNHELGIAPYNGVVAVTSNSRAITPEEYEGDPNYAKVSKECEEVAKLLRVTAPIRIDVRRFKDDSSSRFALFDINMKPNMTGPGRPGRDDQASLTLLAAQSLGWSYPKLLEMMLESSSTLRELRHLSPDKLD